MTYGQLRAAVAGYHQKSPDYFVKNGFDLLRHAINNARKHAERIHDFELNKVLAKITVSPTAGGLISSAVDFNSPFAAIRMRAIETVYYVDTEHDDALYPIYHHQMKNMDVWLKEYAHYRYGDPATRYRDDAGFPYPTLFGQMKALFHGNLMTIVPTLDASRVFAFSGQKWMDDYENNVVTVLTSSTGSTAVTVSAVPGNLVVGSGLLGTRIVTIVGTAITLAANASQTIAAATNVEYTNDVQSVNPLAVNEDYTDWMLEDNSDYLMWAALVEVNHLTQVYVPRQDGYISPPTNLRDKALETMIENDAFRIEQGRQIFGDR